MSAPGRDGNEERKPLVPRPIAAPNARGSSTSQPRPPSNTHSLLPSRSASISRGGAPRMVFRPVRPPRRNVEIKPDPDGPSSISSFQESSPGPSARPPPPARKPKAPIEMTASGPFGMGSGVSGARNSSKGYRTTTFSGVHVKSELSARSDYREPDRADRLDKEQYSEDEDGVEIIDMEDVGTLDILAPTSLPRMRGKGKPSTKSKGVKKEEAAASVRVKKETSATREEGVDVEDANIELEEESEKEEVEKTADALDLSASEEEEVMDDLTGDFIPDDDDDEGDDPENRLYLFQFPPLFPTFVLPEKKKRVVSFSDGTKEIDGKAEDSPSTTLGHSTKESKIKSELSLDERSSGASSAGRKGAAGTIADCPEGQIGRLDVFRDGRVQFRFNDIVMEVTGGSQSSFLQQVMVLDSDQKKATTLGEVHRKFVVAPEIESMLNDVDKTYEDIDINIDDHD